MHEWEHYKFKEDSVVSYHEGGHASTLSLFNFYDGRQTTLVEVDITPILDKGVAGTTYTLGQEYYIPSTELTVYMAGAAAEYIAGFSDWFPHCSHFEVFCNGWGQDVLQATSLLRKIHPGISESRINFKLREYYEKAYNLLMENKKILDLVANELLCKRVLHGSRVDAIVSHHIRGKWIDMKKFMDGMPPPEAWPANYTFGQNVVFAMNWKPPEEVLRRQWLLERNQSAV